MGLKIWRFLKAIGKLIGSLFKPRANDMTYHEFLALEKRKLRTHYMHREFF
jgi:hypothetical protein